MSLHDVTALAVKIAGLVLFVIVLSKIPEYTKSYLQFKNSQIPINILYYILPLLIVGFACLLLFLFPYKISNYWVLDTDTINTSSSEFADNLQIIAIRLIGLLILFWSVSAIVYSVFVYLMYRDIGSVSYEANTFNYPELFSTLVNSGIAVVLLKKARNISALLNSAGN
ncbi:MAG: hypothetical protein QM500_01485 [Methylococcales bacterium]